MSDPLFIAEVKTESPFGFKSEHKWKFLLALAIEHGDMVSVHTDERWGGSFARLAAAAEQIRCISINDRRPLLLAKGIHGHDSEVRMALNCGADLVLVVDRLPSPILAPACIWEPASFSDLVSKGTTSQKILWNQRNLLTGEPRESMWNFNDARRAHQGWLGQASFIETQDDVCPDADAFVVGSYLPEFIASRID